MKRIVDSPWRMGLLSLALALALAACEGPTSFEAEDGVTAAAAEETTTALAATLTDELSLSDEQQEDVQGVMRRHQHRQQDPGFLWFVAADLQATLTDEQKERLFALTEEMDAAGGPRVCGPDGGGFDRPGRFGPGGGPGASIDIGLFDDLLTDEQQAAVAEIRERYRAAFQALAEARRNGDLEDDAFREQAQALHEAMKAEIDALLTDEQRAEIEQRIEARRAEREAEREARREAIRAAMIEALGLTEDQIAALDALHAQQQAALDELIERFEGELLTCDELQAELAALRAAGEEALEGILDETQWEIKRIYDALTVRMNHLARQHGPGQGRPGGPGGSGAFGPGQGRPGGPGGPGGMGPGGRTN